MLAACSILIADFLSLCHSDQLRNSYQVGNDHSLRVIYANGMDTHYQTEPHILAGTLSRSSAPFLISAYL